MDAGVGQFDRGGLLLVANKGDRTLLIIDTQSGQHLAALPVGGVTGHEVAVSRAIELLGYLSTATPG